MDEKTKTLFIAKANDYETKEFLINDPSRFMHNYKTRSDIELAGFIASLLSFGKREQFCKKIQIILDATSGDITTWIKSALWQYLFDKGEQSFYRMYSHNDMKMLFTRLQLVLLEYKTLETCIKENWQTGKYKYLCDVFATIFSQCRIVPQSKNSCKKRLCMYLRWMVRKNSAVDMGLWQWYKAADLIIPLDTHVMQQARIYKLTQKRNTSFTVAQEITNNLKEIWPDDPLKGDFALFGMGINKKLTL